VEESGKFIAKGERTAYNQTKRLKRTLENEEEARGGR
jgi:hypothetical protein